MIKKVYIYFLSGGFSEVFKYAFIWLKKFFYYKSETMFLYRENDNTLPIEEVNNEETEFIQISNIKELEQLRFERIKVLDYNLWFKNGSKAIVGIINYLPISFSWSHFGMYIIRDVCKVNLSHDKCWIGPTFVDISQRGKGINKAQILYQLSNTAKTIKYFITSANAGNIASVKSFERLGFKIGAISFKYYGIFSSGSYKIEYRNLGEDILNFL